MNVKYVEIDLELLETKQITKGDTSKLSNSNSSSYSYIIDPMNARYARSLSTDCI